jgi:RNA polymerase sporulation-specific sigma factor
MGKVEICGTDTSKLVTLTEDEKRELLSKAHSGDEKARERLILGNLRLVLSVMRKFSPKNDTPDDLFQVGCIGLMKAVDNFNPTFEVKFSTYAVPMIIGEIRRFQRDNNSMRISRSIRDLAYKALQIKEAVMSREHREPTTDEIAKTLGCDPKLVEEAVEAIVEPISLHDSVYGDGEDRVFVIDQLSDDTQSDDILIESIALKEALKKLNEREKNIIGRRYYKGRTQMEIAEEIGISQAQVSRIEKQAIDKLRKYMS